MTNKVVFGLVAVSLTIAISGCARVEPQPGCNFYEYNAQRASLLAKNEVRLIPPAPGIFSEMPLNHANVLDKGITNKILVQSTGARREANGIIDIQTRLLNCTDHVLQVEARAQFFDELQRESEAPSAWGRLTIPGHSFATHSTRSTNDRARAYLVEIREGS